MKRLHVHISVPELNSAIQFYNSMFGEQPTKIKEDYAKWQLDDPFVNFAISTRSEKIGLDHLGLQVTDVDELNAINTRLTESSIDAGEVNDGTCCYAESKKSWSFDTAGIPWENFVTMKDAELFGVDNQHEEANNSACCSGQTPVQKSKSACC